MKRKSYGFWLSGLLVLMPLQAVAAVDIDRVVADAGKAWEEFLGTAEFETAYSAYTVLDQVGYSREGVDEEACRARATELDKAVADAPVSVAVVRAALLCAEAIGQQERAGKLDAALLALSREALANGRQLPWPKPIRVLGPNDVYALLHAAGLEAQYEYIELLVAARYFPVVVAARDPESGKVTSYTFDYIEPTSRLKSTNEYWGYPLYKQLLVEFFEEAQVKANQLAAVDMRALRAASREGDVQAKVKALRVSAGYGGIGSLQVWITLCATQPFKGCGDGMEDVLIGLAEKKQLAPMVMLAFVNAEGIVGRRNETLADGLLEAAIRLSSEEEVALQYVALCDNSKRPQATARKPLLAALRRTAVVAELARGKIGDNASVISVAEQQALAAPSSNAIGTGQAWLADHWRQLDKQPARIEASRLAADRGDAHAQSSLAYHLLLDSPQPAPEQAQALMRQAAAGGNTSAMSYLSARAELLHDWKAAERWLALPARSGNEAAMMALASLYEMGGEASGRDPKQAFDWYQEFSKYPSMLEARRAAARMATAGKGTPKDAARAEQWLLQDAGAGDTQSQLTLAIAYLDGELGEASAAKAQPWIDKVLASEDPGGKIGYADWLHRKGKRSEDMVLARRLLIEAQHAGSEWALNNLAWALCTSANPLARDFAAGMAHSQEMLKDPALPRSRLDTVAACQAASGDYAAAARTQQAVIDRYLRYYGLDKMTEDRDPNGFLARLKLYQQGKPYLDKQDETVGN